MDRPGYFGDSLTEPYADIYIIKPNGYVTRFKKPDSRNWNSSIWDDDD